MKSGNKELFRKILILLIVFLLLAISDLDIKPMMFMIFSVAFNTLIIIYLYRRGIPIDVEFSTFSVVIITLTSGVIWGVITAILTKVSASLFSGNIIVDHFFNIVAFSSAAILTNMLSFIGLPMLGLLITLITNVYIFLNCKYVLMLDISANILYTSTRIIFNLGLFVGFSELVLHLIS